MLGAFLLAQPSVRVRNIVNGLRQKIALFHTDLILLLGRDALTV